MKDLAVLVSDGFSGLNRTLISGTLYNEFVKPDSRALMKTQIS